MEGNHVKVCEMMHLLKIYDESSSNVQLHQILIDVYHNFISIYEAAATQLKNLKRKFHHLTDECDYMRIMIEDIIVFCKISLNWVLEDNGKVNYSLANLLMEYERRLLAFIKDSKTSLLLDETDPFLVERYTSILKPKNVVVAYVHNYSKEYYSFLSSYQVIMGDDKSMLKFIDQVVVNLTAGTNPIYLQGDFLKEKLIFLNAYLEFTTMDRNNAQEVKKKLLFYVYSVASRISWYSFFAKWYFESYDTYFIEQVSSDVLVGVLRALILQVDGSSSSIITPLTGDLLVHYADCIQKSIYLLASQVSYSHIIYDQEIEDVHIQKSLPVLQTQDSDNSLTYHVGILNMTRFLTGYQPLQQNNGSDITSHFQALLRDVASAIYSCLNIRKKYSSLSEKWNYGLEELMEKMNLIQEEIIQRISACITSDRTAQDFPKVYPLGFFLFVFVFLKNLVDSKYDLIPDQFFTVRKNLLLSKSFLQHIYGSYTCCITTDYASKSIVDWNDKENKKQIKTLIEMLISLINYLKLGRFHGEELNEMLISAQVVSFKIARCFFLRMSKNKFHWWNVYSDSKVQVVDLHVRVGILRAFVLSSLDSSGAPLLTDELLMGYGECIQDNLIDLVRDNTAIDPLVKDQFKIIHYGLPFLMHLICTYMPKQSTHKERLSEIKVRVHGLVVNLGSLIYGEQTKRSMGINLYIQFTDLIEKLNLIQEEIINIIYACMISDRTVEEYPELLGFLIFDLEFLKNLVGCKYNLIPDQFETIRWNLLLSISFLKNIENHRTKDIGGHSTTDCSSTHTEGLDDDIDDSDNMDASDDIDACDDINRDLDTELELLAMMHKEMKKEIKTMIEKSMFLIQYLKSGQINGEELNELLISAQVVAFKTTRYFLLMRCGNNFNWWKVYPDTINHVIDSHARIGSLRALVLLGGSSSPPLIDDEVLMGYGKCVQDNLIELVRDKAIVDPMKNQFEILHNRLPFLMNIIFTYPPKQSACKERLSKIKVRMHALVMNLGSIIYLFYNDLQTKGNMEMELSIRLTDLIVNLNLIQEEAVGIIISACMISDRTEQEYPLSVLIFILEFFMKLMDSKSDLLKDQFYTIRRNVLLSISFLKNIEINTIEDIEGHTSPNITDLDDKEKDKQIKSLIEKSMLLISYLELNQVNGEELNELLISAQVVAFKIARYFLFMRYGNNFHWWNVCSETKERALDSHVRVGILRALVLSLNESSVSPLIDELLAGYVECIQDNLIELVRDKAVVDPVKHQFKIFHEELSLLMNLLFSYPPKQRAHNERLSEIKMRIHALVMNLGSIIYLYYDDLQMKGNIAEGLSIRLADLNGKLSLIKDETMGIFPSVILSGVGLECPETDQLGFFNFLLDNWKKLMECRSDLIMTWKDQFETIHENLIYFRSFIQNVKHNDSTIADDELHNLCNRIMDAGYVAEYILSSFAERSFPVWCIPLWISEFTEHIKLINADVSEKKANDKEIRDADNKDVDSTDHPSQISSKELITPMTTDAMMDPSHDKYSPALPVLTSTHVVVGFEVEMELIRERISNFRKQLDVISIIGMPGLGKTTLARKVYDDPFTESHFDVRAWCCVSQDYNKKELFLTILGSVSEVTDLIRRKSETDLSVMVHKQLMGRRYFIVLDDVWEIDAFMELKCFFPDDGNKSRIMLTSRSRAIGLGARLHSDPIELDLLTDEVSWDLLERKVYGERKCPLELHHVGNEITRKCKGLPLSVVVVAGILAKSIQLGFWEQVARNFSSYLAMDPESQWMAALELSYKFLPDFLKPSFLYLGAFPEDKEIRADKLMWLWIAEGLVHKSGSKSLESEAESNLMDLIDRSLVMVSKRRSDGRVKACNVHDLLRDMCLTKAKEDSFLQQIHLSPHNEILDRVAYQRRLSLFLKSDNTTFSKPLIRMLSINPPLRTLLSFNMKTNLNSVFARMKSLRVLHSEGTIISSEASDDVTTLVCLRYVSIQTAWTIIPPSISSIWTLETLIIKGARGEIIVPTQIWKMVKLRHLHINPRASFKIAPKESSKLENLVTLSTPVIDPGEEGKLISKVPNVQKLSCVFTEGTYHSFESSIKFPNLESLCTLESLKMSYYGAVKRTWKFKFPSNLKKLSLSKFRMKWSEISMFQELKNLEVLKLRDGGVLDDFWDTGDEDEFISLKLLKLESLNIKRWTACAENFPRLEKVVLERCRRLEEIPSDLGEFVTLQKIEVLWCNPSAAKMAKEIQDEQKDVNVLLKVQIYPSPQMD